jgi:hypothetical protein
MFSRALLYSSVSKKKARSLKEKEENKKNGDRLLRNNNNSFLPFLSIHNKQITTAGCS